MILWYFNFLFAKNFDQMHFFLAGTRYLNNGLQLPVGGTALPGPLSVQQPNSLIQH